MIGQKSGILYHKAPNPGFYRMRLFKDLKKQFRLAGVLAILCCVFFAGFLAHRYNIHRRIPILRKAHTPHFYPGRIQDASHLFDTDRVTYPFTFIVYGDSREPAGDEKGAIMDRIIAEEPLFVIQLGDIVPFADEHQWQIADTFDGRIAKHGIAYYPVLGNHEYYGKLEKYPEDPGPQLEPYFRRFPMLGTRRWYSYRYGNSTFVVLDTNTDYSPGSYQRTWLMAKLKEKKGGFLFIVFHHPPYTKSAYKSPREPERSLAKLIESYNGRDLQRADIVFSSHAHNYERYRYGGINYVVSGGGGAPQYPVRRDPDDFYREPGDTFHYCKITVSRSDFLFEMVKLDPDTDTWHVADSFTVSR
jgi:hypothetical protein